ncbi:MAG TPA: FHA domain-containing serine/threonine-protein kinase [Ktedonobacteraceae bacterium]|nr:FHA domain-containing serine/threonine-protein kinase [Ktedonobacteraceae bacterium]
MQQMGTSGDMDALVGKSLGQFRIVERIGAGGMATVFKAYQPVLDRYVAIKVLPDYHAQDPVFKERFRREAVAAAKLDHPNIVQIYSFGEEEGITYIVMQYVDGGTLKDKLRQSGALSAAEALRFVIQAAEGLGAAHEHGIVHRDVKPANMLLRKDGHLLLSDFGIVKILEGTTNLTRVGTGIGTPQYMSPEQGTGQPVDASSDIYSLGIVLFHCLTGRVPFNAESPLTITVKHLNEPLPIAFLRHAGVPQPIEQVILKMTAKMPAERYQTMAEVVSELARAASSAGVQLSWMISGPLPPPDQSQFVPQASNASLGRNLLPARTPLSAGLPAVTVACFRCQAQNPGDRLYCTSCGYELADRKAAADRVMGPNGRPILARFKFQTGPMAGREYRFHQDMTTIGRTNGNDLIISGGTVSRQHARLWFSNGYWYLADVKSANGTFVNNMRLQPNQPVALNDGDKLNFGDEIVLFNIIY